MQKAQEDYRINLYKSSALNISVDLTTIGHLYFSLDDDSIHYLGLIASHPTNLYTANFEPLLL